MYIFKRDIKEFNKIPKKSNLKNPKKAIEYINLPFYKDWLVGFTNAVGYFIIKKNKDCCYQLKQKIHIELFESFKLFFNTNQNFSFYKKPINSYYLFSISSIKDIQTVINFFSFEGVHPLIGQKYIQYSQWLLHFHNRDRSLPS